MSNHYNDQAIDTQPTGEEESLGNNRREVSQTRREDPAIQRLLDDKLIITHAAEFDFYSLACCASPWFCCDYSANRCCLDNTRLYFYVLENGYEYNTPIPVFDTFFTLMVRDHVYRYYFDRGVYNQTSCLRKIHFFQGKPTAFPGEVQHVWMGEDCSPSWNGLLNCYWPDLCGERVRVIPAETVCFCIPNRSNAFYNCGGTCGPKEGEPICLQELVSSLKRGSAERLATALERARSQWSSRTQLN